MKKVLKQLFYTVAPVSMFFTSCGNNETPFVQETGQAKYWQTEMSNKSYDVEQHTRDSLKAVLDSTEFVTTGYDQSAARYDNLNGAFINNKGDTVARIVRDESNDLYHDKKYTDDNAPLSEASLNKKIHLSIEFADHSKFMHFGESFSNMQGPLAKDEHIIFIEKPKL